MDFTKILDAIDIIVNQKLTEAAFTRFINGTVVEIVNSEQNTYKITTDNGKTNFIAQAIAADIDGGIVYEKNDEVKLLQLNGSNNSNENIYILGHSVDFTKQDLNEIKNHFIENVSQKITLNDKYTYILENSSDVIKDIKLKGSFGIKAQIKYLKQNSNNKKNYGFKISFKDKNNVNLLTYNLDVNTMIGEPYKFTDFVLQKIEKYLINTFIIDKINSIVIQAFNTDDFEYKDLEIYSAIWTEDENEYQITFKNPTRVDYITTKENGKEEFSLQVILLKNNKTFATNTCKYLWFIQDASIDNNSDAYSSYGGEGWRLLNTVEEITYLNINQEEYVQDVIKNDIGSCLKITNENTTSYHNYFKCVVLYNGLIIKSEVKHILNLDAAGDINFRLGVLTEKAAAAQEILSLDENINTYTEDGFYLGFIFNKIEEYDNYEVVITRTNSIDDNNDKYIFSTTKGTLLNKNSQYYNILEKQIYKNIYPSYTYNCTISATKEDIKRTLQTIEKTYYVSGSEIREIVQYYNNKDSVVMPDFLIIKEDEWVDNYEELNSRNWTAINIIGRKKLNIQTEWEYFWAFIHGSSQTADQVEEFNRLTRNGKDKGLYYGKGFRVTEDIKPLDGKIYYIYNENESKYVEQESLKEFDSTKIYYEKTDDLALFINADYIQTGTLRVGNEGNEKFFASITNDKVSIGGFTVDDKSLSWINKNNDAEQVYLGQEGLKLGNSFAIDQFGNVNWNANNSPIRQIYCVNNTASLPTNKEDYNNLPNDSDNTWHKIKSNNDKYYAQSSDGGASWAGPFLIEGQAGNGIKDIENSYLATISSSPNPSADSEWKSTIENTGYSANTPYLWLKQTINYTNTNKNPDVKIILSGVWGEPGEDGAPGSQGEPGKDGTGIGQTIVKYLCLSENDSAPTSENTNWQKISEAEARGKLSSDTPVLWKWIRFHLTDGNNVDSIFILDRLKQNTFIRYADMDAFESNEYNSNKKGFFSQTRDIEIRSGKIYYVYNSETKEYSKVENPEKENLKSYYEFLVLKSDKDIYAVATANTGWIGTYVGYNANPSFSDYIWSYYLTELNRNNFMMTVLEEKKDTDGNDVDGIYKYTSTIDGKNYIGITASAIRTGNLNADLITTGSLLIQTKQDTQYTYNVGDITFAALSGDQYKYIIIPNINGKLFIEKYTLISGKAKMGSTTYTFYTQGGRGTYEFRFSSTYSTDEQLVFSVDRYDTCALSLNDFSFDYKLKEDETYCNFDIDKKQVTLIAPNVINGIGDFSYNNALFYLDSSKDSENFSINTSNLKLNSSGGQVYAGNIDTNMLIVQDTFTLKPGVTITSQRLSDDASFYLGCLNPTITRVDLYPQEYGFLWKNCSYTSKDELNKDFTVNASASIIFPWFPSGAPIQGTTEQIASSKFKLKIALIQTGVGESPKFKISKISGTVKRNIITKIYLHFLGDPGDSWLESKTTITFSGNDGDEKTFEIGDYFKLPFWYWDLNGICFSGQANGEEMGLYYEIKEFDNQDSQVKITQGQDYIGFLISGNLLPYYGKPLTGWKSNEEKQYYNLGCPMTPWNKAYINNLYLNNDLNATELFSIYWQQNEIDEDNQSIQTSKKRQYRIVFGDPIEINGHLGRQIIALYK